MQLFQEDKKPRLAKRIGRHVLWWIVIICVGVAAAYLFSSFLKKLQQEELNEETALKQPLLQMEKSEYKKDWFKPGTLASSQGIVQSIQEVPEQGGWINTAPLDVSYLSSLGNIILLEFWSPSCLSCIENLVNDEKLWRNYQNHGLIVVGVYTPKFKAERPADNALAFVLDNKLTFPIYLDGNKQLWSKFENSKWPTRYVISPQGKIIYSQFTFVDDKELETVIRQQLAKAGWLIPDNRNVFAKNQDKKTLSSTPGLYAGFSYLRREYCNTEKVLQNKLVDYLPLVDLTLKNCLYFAGPWRATAEYQESVGEGRVEANVAMTSLYALANAPLLPLRVEVLLDSLPIPQELAGKDVIYLQDKSYIEVTSMRLYELVKSSEQMNAKISLITPAQLQFYGFIYKS